MNTLDAVNEILESIGQPPVTTLDTGGASEEADAERFLDRANRNVQKRGWQMNTIVQKQHTPDGSGLISLGSSVLRMSVNPNSFPLRASIRNGALYDLDNDTNVFTKSVYLDVVSLVPFTQLTQAMANYIVKYAAQDFQRYKKRGRFDEAVAEREIRPAKVEALQEDSDLRRANTLTTEGANRVRGNRRNYRYHGLGH